jgi:hypothetical protein
MKKRNGSTEDYLGLNITKSSSVNDHLFSASKYGVVSENMGMYFDNGETQQPASDPHKNFRNRNRTMLQSSPSDSHLFSGRRPRPLSLPPNGIPRLSSSNSTSASFSTHYRYKESYLDNSCDNNNSKKLMSSSGNNLDVARKSAAYTQKFPISYSTPGLSNFCKSSQEKLTITHQKRANGVDSTRRLESNVVDSTFTTNATPVIQLQRANSVYKSSECPRYSFHSLPVRNNSNKHNNLCSSRDGLGMTNLEFNSNGSSSVYIHQNNNNNDTEQTFKKMRSPMSSLLSNDGKGMGKMANGRDNSSQLQRSGSLKLSRSRNSAFAMSNSRSFTNGSSWADVCNTLPRSGKQKSGEQLALFLDIMSTQERFVKVSEMVGWLRN